MGGLAFIQDICENNNDIQRFVHYVKVPRWEHIYTCVRFICSSVRSDSSTLLSLARTIDAQFRTNSTFNILLHPSQPLCAFPLLSSLTLALFTVCYHSCNLPTFSLTLHPTVILLCCDVIRFSHYVTSMYPDKRARLLFLFASRSTNQFILNIFFPNIHCKCVEHLLALSSLLALLF